MIVEKPIVEKLNIVKPEVEKPEVEKPNVGKSIDWKPGAGLDRIKARAQLLLSIRQFFSARNVLEVETPLLAATTATDVYIQSFVVTAANQFSSAPAYLQTSPEFAMKRMLAAGSGPIYQLCKAFRAEESGRMHNREFTMLEWYLPGFSLADIMDEVEQLLVTTLQCAAIERISYRELFRRHLAFDPHQITFDELRALATNKINFNSAELSATDYLQQLLAQCIEPQLPEYCFIYNYPLAQAALAATGFDGQGQRVAYRFELFGKGMELANGYFELTDADEQGARFAADNCRRRQLQLPEYPFDEKLLAALASGLPACAGVALGVDRLLMLKVGATDISEVISFTDA